MWRALALAVGLMAQPAAACGIFTVDDFPKSHVRSPDSKDWVLSAHFTNATDIYDHEILGREKEPDTLVVLSDRGISCLVVKAGADMVFEDLAPRLADLDGDGRYEVIVVRSHIDKGAQLAVYGMLGERFGVVATTPFIGQRHRWLAPAGIGDFGGDGEIEIAYVDRPHLAKELVFVRLEGDTLREVGRLKGLTNHRIGNSFITGGVRNCGQGDELVLASGDWVQAMVVRMDRGARAAGPVARIDTLLACRD